MHMSYFQDPEMVIEGTEVSGDVAADAVDLGTKSRVNVVVKV